MIRPLLGRAPARPTLQRIDLHQGDVAAIEIIEDGENVRLAVYDDARRAIPLIAAQLDREARRQLVSALVGVDLARAAHG